jgi:hypothetical protein
MKRLIIAVAVIGALVLGGLAYGYSLDLFKAIKLNNFQMAITIRKAESILSSYELTSKQETTHKGNISTYLEFDNGELGERLRLHFMNGSLIGFDYENFQLSVDLLNVE